MRSIVFALDAATGVFMRDLRVMLSYRLRIFSILMAPIVSVLLFYYVSRLVTTASLGSSDGYFAFVITGMAALGVLTAAVGTASATLRNELAAGTYERLILSPFGPLRSSVALMVFPVLLAIVVGVVTIVFAALVCGLALDFPRVLAAFPAAVLVALAFAPIGVFVVALMFIIRQTASGVNVLLTGFSIVAGVYFPIALLPVWIRWTSDVQPFTPAVGLLRNLLSTAPTSSSPWADAAKLTLFSLALLPPALYALHRSIRHSQRRGTITEY